MKLGSYAVEQDYSQYVAKASDIIYGIVGTATKGEVGVPTVVTSPSDLVNKFGNISPDCLGLYAASYFLNQSSKLWYVRAASESAAASQVKLAGINAEGTEVADALLLDANSKGTSYDGYIVMVSNVSETEDTCTLVIKNRVGNTLETINSLSFGSAETTFESKYLVFKSKSSVAIKLKAGEYVLSGGNDGISDIDSGDFITAGNKLASDNIDINLFSVPGVSDDAVVVSMLQMAETRGDCLYLVDPPNNLTPDAVADWHNGEGAYSSTKLNSSYGALYYSWQRIYDPVNKVYVEVPPSVPVAPAYAYSAKVSEVWYAPAGLKRGTISGVLKPVTSPDTGAMDNLYTGSNSVNCIINDPQVGLCIFGQKTLSRLDSALNRVNVRMLLNYLKRVVVAACRHLTFEPNDRVTWNNFEDLIEPTLKSIKSRRGIYDYKIVKGSAIVTDEDIDNYRMPCKIMIRPTKAAEEIPIYFTITSTGADFNDVLEADGITIIED